MGNDNRLTAENYYSAEMDREYCSASQYKKVYSVGMQACEASFVAQLNGEYVEKKSDSLLIGSLVDSLYENDGDITVFANEHPECFSTRGASKGELKAVYKKGIECYERSKSDELFSLFMSGEKQRVFTGDIEGVKFKCKLDSYIPHKMICDLKTTKSITMPQRVEDTGYVSFIEAYGYDIQMAIYQELVYQNTGERLPCFIAAVSKEDEPDIEVIWIDQDKLDAALIEVKNNVKNIDMLKNGEVEPIRCERCPYCRKTKRLTKAIHYSEIMERGV